MTNDHDAELREAAKLLGQVNQIVLKANDLQRRFAPAPATAAVVRVVERAPNDQLEAHARAFLADTTDDPTALIDSARSVAWFARSYPYRGTAPGPLAAEVINRPPGRRGHQAVRGQRRRGAGGCPARQPAGP